MDKKYTGRKIAVINGINGILEPLEAIVIDCHALGIDEIYSLGNNIGTGNDSDIVIDMLLEYNIKSVAGNFERCCTQKINFADINILDRLLRTREKLLPQLREERLEAIRNFPNFYNLNVGGEEVIICHSFDEVRYNDAFLGWSGSIIQGDNNNKLYGEIEESYIYTSEEAIPFNKECFARASYLILCERECDMGFDIIERTVLYNERNLHSVDSTKRKVTGKTRKLLPFNKGVIQL